MNISNATGLPELPVDQLWRVKVYDGYWNTPYAVVQIIEKVAIKTRKYIDFLLFRIPTGWVEEEEIRAHYEWAVWDPEKESNDSDRFQIFAGDGKKYAPLNPDKLTPKHILSVAEHIILERDAREKAKALIGEYPPNKLEEEN